MAIIVLTDHAGIGCAGWVLRSIFADTAAVLLEQGHAQLADWMNSEECMPILVSHFDARGLTKRNQAAFNEAFLIAYSRTAELGMAGWPGDPASWKGYFQLISSLEHQLRMEQAGEPVSTHKNLSEIWKYDGTTEGPGWAAPLNRDE